MHGAGAATEFPLCTKHWSDLPQEVLALLRRGTVIPAHPLALDASRRLDPACASAR